MLLGGAGADVHCLPSTSEALRIIDRMVLSAAVLDGSMRAKGCRQIMQRLRRRAVPFVLCTDAGQNEPRTGVPILIKPVTGGELVETLCRLIQDEKEKTPGAMVERAGRALMRDKENLVSASRNRLGRAPM
jgi:hypothetical protein